MSESRIKKASRNRGDDFIARDPDFAPPFRSTQVMVSSVPFEGVLGMVKSSA